MARQLRTAVLVVHGMGSQRPLETVRGVINAVWFDDDDHTKNGKKLWSHPEPSGVDLDLTVMTTNEIPETKDERAADFHELYWAHQMSETKAVAVLLWLFELGRRGPHFKTGMNGLWWCGAVYLCLMLLSVSLLTLKSIIWLVGIENQPQKIVGVFGLMLLIAVIAGLVAAVRHQYWKLTGALIGILLLLAGLEAWAFISDQAALARWTSAFIAPVLALLAAYLLMSTWGCIVFAATYALSLAFFAIILLTQHGIGFWDNLVLHFQTSDLPWSMLSRQQSVIAALCVLGVYVLMNAAFLQPYLGDAARYFRNSPANVAVRRTIRKDAVDTLDQLHRSRNYDRIIVVAHSLGTVVAYDMLRAYYSRICSQIPIDKNKLGPQFDLVDGGTLDCGGQRRQGRQLIGKFAETCALLNDSRRQGLYGSARPEEVDAWLVTDFVTLGSPLTHARYLMTKGLSEDKIEQEFWDHVREREFPLCPPLKQDGDGLIAFTGLQAVTRLHHGGMFGMTRWSNLYFPIVNIFWGDAIGGPVQAVFGGCVKDTPVSTKKAGGTRFFTHTAYWKTDCPDKRAAPHLAALIDAIDLADKDKA